MRAWARAWSCVCACVCARARANVRLVLAACLPRPAQRRFAQASRGVGSPALGGSGQTKTPLVGTRRSKPETASVAARGFGPRHSRYVLSQASGRHPVKPGSFLSLFSVYARARAWVRVCFERVCARSQVHVRVGARARDDQSPPPLHPPGDHSRELSSVGPLDWNQE